MGLFVFLYKFSNSKIVRRIFVKFNIEEIKENAKISFKIGQRTDTLHEDLHENLKRRKVKYLAKMKFVAKETCKAEYNTFYSKYTFSVSHTVIR